MEFPLDFAIRFFFLVLMVVVIFAVLPLWLKTTSYLDNDHDGFVGVGFVLALGVYFFLGREILSSAARDFLAYIGPSQGRFPAMSLVLFCSWRLPRDYLRFAFTGYAHTP